MTHSNRLRGFWDRLTQRSKNRCPQGPHVRGRVKCIDHVAILVEDIDAALPFWRDSLGLELTHRQEISTEEAEVAFLVAGPSQIELARPTTAESGMARYLAKRGPGLHHIALQVDDLEAILARLKDLGVRLINEKPVIAAEGKKAAFIHPTSADGVLVELYEVE